MINKAGRTELEKLVEDIPFPTLAVPYPKKLSTKKHAQKRAKPHLRSHIIKGKAYYYYCRGNDREIYLGSAQSILKAVKG